MRLKALHHARFKVTDLDKTERFAADFGLTTAHNDGQRLYMRTAGGDAYSYVAEQSDMRGFVGMAFTVEGVEDLQEAVDRHGATPIRTLDAPGGGQSVTLTNPEGLQIELLHGVAESPTTEPPPHLSLNAPGAMARMGQAQHNRAFGPAHLYRLGHIGLYVKDFATCAAWYQDVLGLLVSDTIHTGEPNQKIVGFFRLDHGEDYVDHHTLFIAQFGKSDCHHISFEVQDFEAQMMAHRWLLQQGWTPNWGVGRHPLGSHVFDVWFDPDNYRFETFSDTDVLQADRQPENHDIHHTVMDLWSSDSAERYFK
jgi:catechol 2,3-dioxygenase-like lactoylglutathione lyase family enzyme